jgi:AraC-like DNA-binding protein
MRYEKFAPDKALVPFVECYFVWESLSPRVEELVIESPPNAYCSIVFNYGDPYFLKNKKYERLQVPASFLAGLSIYKYSLLLKGTIGMAGIVFKPSALATLFGLPMYEYLEERADLRTIFQPALAESLEKKVRDAPGAKARAKLLDDFLLQQVALRKPEPDYIDQAANFILDNHGMLQVGDLLKESCMSRRTFERRFFQKVGLSPKYYARVRRIGYLLNLVAGKKKVDWARIFYQCAYYDQAHFIKDFEEFTGRTPQQYLKDNAELANFVAKPKSQEL